MSDDAERGDGEIRKRAAWLLALLAVVAGLFVVLMVSLLHTSGGPHEGAVADIDPPSSDQPFSTPVAPRSSTSPSDITIGKSPSATTTSAASPPASATKSKVPKPSCPGTATCTVPGDVSGAMTAINAYRAGNGKNPLPTSNSPVADKCALTSGDDCPSSYVWVRVDNLSGASVVTGVNGFHSSDDLLDDQAKGFQVGWAYDPGAKSLYCALVRID